MSKQEKKERGPKYTAPSTMKARNYDSFSSWSRSLESQLNHQKLIKEEARKCAEHRGYTPVMKIGKRFKHFFDQEVLDAQKRAKRKKKRTKNDSKNK